MTAPGRVRMPDLGELEAALVDYLLAWIPYGGPPNEQTFLKFGITNNQVAERIWRAAQRRPQRPASKLEFVASIVRTLDPTMAREAVSRRASAAPPRVDPERTGRAPQPPHPDTPSTTTPSVPFAWQQHAKCRELALEVFYGPDSERGGRRSRSVTRAKRICKACPVVSDCLEHALKWPEPYGIWGATTPAERRRILCDHEQNR